MNRRTFLAAALAAWPCMACGLEPAVALPAVARPLQRDRRCVSRAIESRIAQVKSGIVDPFTASMFEVCYADTVDRAVRLGTRDGRPDTFLITGDIDAMWLRDSTAQVWPYLKLARHDEVLRTMLAGLVNRQAGCVLIDPYANAFTYDPNTPSPHTDDKTDMKAGVFTSAPARSC